jgi:hypothetical protein
VWIEGSNEMQNVRWETRQFRCPEQEMVANLLIQWRETEGKPALNGVSCDNPRLKDLDNWECGWACWQQIASE